MTKIENNDDSSMRNPIFIMDFPENVMFTIFRFFGVEIFKKWQKKATIHDENWK